MEQVFNTFIGCWTISNLIGLICGALVGFGISYGPRKKSCTHNWVLIEDGELFQYNNNFQRKIKVGFMKVYECSHCKKMRKETIEI